MSALNIEAGLYLHDDGETYPITTWLCAEGECDREDATACVAGYEGRWFAINLADFEPAPCA